jgi:HAMP domain-containing protein
MGLKAKFNIVMLVAFCIGLGLAALLSYQIVQSHARQEVLQIARLMMESARAIRSYTVSEITPLIADQMQVRFLPHSVPSWAAQTNLQKLGDPFTHYIYKEAALNPTNPADRATDWEADIINVFRRDASLTEFVLERDAATGASLTLSRPLRIADANCLTCHSSPAAAPATMVDLYGSGNGFGWKMDEVVGAQVVSVPMALALDKAHQEFLVFLGGLAAVFAAMMLLLNLLLHYLIIKPVGRISTMAEEISTGNMDIPEFLPKGKDEIASLAASFNRMRRSLSNALKMLGED